MNIAGIVKSSFIDYPGCASTVIFLGGCNFNCGYCHNPEIVRGGQGDIQIPDFLAFVEKRRRFVDAVCISGGEPTLYGGELYALIRRLKELGCKVKLDTNGTNPELLRLLLGAEPGEPGAGGFKGAGPCLLDRVAMDIKGPWEKYARIAGLCKRGLGAGNGAGSGDIVPGESLVASVRESLALLLAVSGSQGFSYELRTTVCRELLSGEDIQTMAAQLAGADCWYLQTFKKQSELLDPKGQYSAYSGAEMEELRQAAEALGAVKKVGLRS